MTHQIYTGSLDDGEDATVTLELARGQSYTIMGACDTDCEDLDLTLYAGSDEIDSDLELDDFPVVEVNVDRAGTFRVEVTMADCDTEPCRYGIGVWSRTTGSGSGSASSAGSGKATRSNLPNYQATPSYGTITLAAGFDPDPYVRSISAGGDDEVEVPGDGCSGWINADAPDLDLNYTTGNFKLYIYAKARTDVTLIVNKPDGTWVCSDDVNGTDPSIEFADSPSGNYNIWIGTFESSSSPLPEATLYISEKAPRW